LYKVQKTFHKVYQISYDFFHTRKYLFSWRMASYGILRHVALVRTDISEELSSSFIRVTRIGELETTLAVTSNRRTSHDVTSQKTTFFVFIAVKTSSLTSPKLFFIFEVNDPILANIPHLSREI
jgi:hypothetical protein